jgi:hypothetical protein
LYEECEVDEPSTECENYDNLIPVPDSDAGRFYENPLRKAGEVKKNKTYVRSVINNIAEARGR